ncbi:MAG TPA: signal recognition particle receptor subunit alpha, partial [Actinomycetes bacterium]|nr:signal recognition particle receptor subunit alpha [Actinomycetes bacterium]
MEIVLGLVAVLVVSGLLAAFIAARPRRRDTGLEPPPAAPLPPPKAAVSPPAQKPPKTKRPPIPSEEELARQAAEVVAEAEAVLAGAREEPLEEIEPGEVAPPPVKPRFRDRIGKARGLLAGYLGSVRSRAKIDEETWDELEEALIRADVGIAATTALLDQLRAQVKAEGISTPEMLVDALKTNLKKRLSIADRTLRIEPGQPNVWLFVGVNGVGKTTTIGKVGAQQTSEGRSVIMAAGDTFRAAAAE